MKVGIIAEGWDDCGVIHNLVSKLVPIDSFDDIRYIRPKMDATDGDIAAFSNWSMVREECIHKTELDMFLYTFPNEPKLLIVHIDTAECQDYGVVRPVKNNGKLKEYSIGLRNMVITEIENWLGTTTGCNVCYAIAIEEIEAWIIALLANSLRKDTASINDPKHQLNTSLNNFMNPTSLKRYRAYKSNKGAFEASKYLSSGLTQKKKRKNAEEWNHSLHLFCEELRILFP